MDINNQGSGKSSNNQAILPRSRANEQAGNRTQASRQLSDTWGKPSAAILSNLINLILLLIQSLKGSGKPPVPPSNPQPQPNPQPVYGAIQPPEQPPVQPVYGAIQPPDVQPVYGAIQPPEPEIQPVYGAVISTEPTNEKQ